MQFLDAIGLAYFWEKIKDWVNARFFSKRGGEISPEKGLNYVINGEHLGITISGNENETINIFDVDENGMEAISIKKSGGTATQVLMADGSVKELSQANGIPVLDAGGNIPLSQLGNLDTTVAEVVTALPTSNIKRHIYLVKDSDTTNNKYAEYVYTGDISAAYDSTKWEKLGDFRATVDLKDYSKKSETISGLTWQSRGSDLVLFATVADGNQRSEFIPTASSSTAGAMSNTDKAKLDGIAANANNYSLPLAANGTRGGIQLGYTQNGRNYPVLLSGEKAYVNVPWTDTNTTYDLSPYAKTADVNAALSKKVDVVSGKGLSTNDFTAAYKSKLDRIKLSVDSINLDNVCIFEAYPAVNHYVEDVTIEFKSAKNETWEISIEGATTESAGVMSVADKTKLDGITEGATADSAITTEEIDALFV